MSERAELPSVWVLWGGVPAYVCFESGSSRGVHGCLPDSLPDREGWGGFVLMIARPKKCNVRKKKGAPHSCSLSLFICEVRASGAMAERALALSRVA